MDSPFNDIDPDRYFSNSANSCTCYTPVEFNLSLQNNSTHFSVIHMNARSLSKNFENISTFLSTLCHRFSIIALSETWISNQPLIPFHLDGYTFIHSDRLSGRGGGVAFFVKNNIDFSLRDIMPDRYEDSTFEFLFIDCSIGFNQKFTVGVVYRKPNSNIDLFLDNYNSLLDMACSSNRNIIVTGDFNINLLNSSENPIDNTAHTFLNINLSYGLKNLINIPTRVTSTSSTLIDHLFCNMSNTEFVSGTISTDISDHLPIFTLLKHVHCKSSKALPKYSRTITKENIESLKKELCKVDWSVLYTTNDVEEMYEKFMSIFKPLYDRCLPLSLSKEYKPKIRKPWITKKLFKNIKKKNKLYKKFIQDRSFLSERKFKSYRNKLNQKLKKAKKTFYSKQFNNLKNDPKGIWNKINELLNKSKSPLPSYFIHNHEKIQDEQTIANEFNSYFKSVPHSVLVNGPGHNPTSNVQCNDFTDYLKRPLLKSFFFKPVTEVELVEICRSLKNTNSTGPDDISPIVIKQIIHVIVKPLVHICNVSFASGIFPSDLKIAKVIPVFKKGDQHLFQNYRPISLLPCFSKLIETCAAERLYSFLSNSHVLSNFQFGFRPKHCTTHAMLHLQDKVRLTIEKNKFCIGIFMDLSKAFDVVNHNILIFKLQYSGVRGTPLKWFQSYLSNRRQFTQCSNSSSDYVTISHGVPQGSILGPLLFLIYINDLILASNKFDFIMYADDTTLLYSQPELNGLEENLNSELQLISNWFKANKLVLNIQKTNFCVFQGNYHGMDVLQNINVSIDAIPISRVDVVNFLGVKVDCNLKWDNHINYIKAKISTCIGILHKLKFCVPPFVLFTLYNALILPYISYCIVVWGNSSITRVDSLHKLQKKAIRICTGSRYDAHSGPLFHKLNTLNVHDLFKYHTAILGFNFFQGLLPDTISAMFITNNQIHTHNTRSTNLLHLWKVTNSSSKRTIRYNLPQVWNSLPSIFRLYANLSLFKRKLKADYCSKYV